MNNYGYNNSSAMGRGSSPFNQFTSYNSGYGGQSFGSKEFMESNSLVAKIAFLLLVLFLFVLCLQLGIWLLTKIFSAQNSPHLIDGMVDAKQQIVINQDPGMTGSKTIGRSVNENDGIEFTWSTWIYINSLDTTNQGKYKHIFHKGNYDLATTNNGLNFPNNAPGMYLAPNTNALVILMNTFHVINEEIMIPDIPINKWVNVIIRCQNTTLDVYINGTITRSVKLLGVPKQNYGEVYIAANGGFDGYISNLWYYNYALGTSAIQRLVSSGPNTAFTGSNAMQQKNPDYLSLRWYFYGVEDMFNPGAINGPGQGGGPSPTIA